MQYSRVAKTLHWLIAFLIIAQLAGGLLMVRLEPNAKVFQLFQMHKSFGFVILFLSVLRLFWRLTHKTPPLPSGMKAWEKWGAKFSHYGFYILMIGIPLSGWVMVSASTRVITTKIFKMLKVPDFPGIARSESMEALTKNVHEYLAYTMIALLALHIGAALKHHYVNKDDVLLRMMPGKRSQ